MHDRRVFGAEEMLPATFQVGIATAQPKLAACPIPMAMVQAVAMTMIQELYRRAYEQARASVGFTPYELACSYSLN